MPGSRGSLLRYPSPDPALRRQSHVQLASPRLSQLIGTTSLSPSLLRHPPLVDLASPQLRPPQTRMVRLATRSPASLPAPIGVSADHARRLLNLGLLVTTEVAHSTQGTNRQGLKPGGRERSRLRWDNQGGQSESSLECARRFVK